VPERVPAPKPNRPRNPDAPPKPERPRDELGRPLAFGETSRLEMEDFDSFPLERNHELGIGHFNAGHFFPAHEAWETAWKQAKGTPDAEFFKGLSQLGAGYVHLQRANAHGAYTLMRRGAGRIERYPSPHHGVDTEALAAAALRDAEAVERAQEAGRPIPDLTPPRV
jgi:predicted metal-dependent hydrolase